MNESDACTKTTPLWTKHSPQLKADLQYCVICSFRQGLLGL
jgi:hypothetical protein